MIEECGVKFVWFWFIDVIGIFKFVVIVLVEVEGVFVEGIGFDGFVIEGLICIYEFDLFV